MLLTWHSYRYYPYERVLAERELRSLLNGATLRETGEGFEIANGADPEPIRRLTYFAGASNGAGLIKTAQALLEEAARAGKNRQATRYSVHGLHEYKGKFNPQVAKAILNIFGIDAGHKVLDPFCGSGTALIECVHVGASGTGTDLNPLAVYLANAKVQALLTSAEALHEILSRLRTRISRTRRWRTALPYDPRGQYLQSWFDPEVLSTLEILREKITDTAGPLAPVFLCILSNLLRDYSQQDPHDLRIRRRKSPLPSTPVTDAFLLAADQAIERLEAAQDVLGSPLGRASAMLCDVGALQSECGPAAFDAAITSPPYAMALPYIDTQRLSLVWLDLLPADRVLELEAALIGSREIRGLARRDLLEAMEDNAAALPRAQANFCRKLRKALGPRDGFRRQAVPSLLYRYFVAMRDSFLAVKGTMKQGAPYALIVGHNHTVLGGRRFDIDTPSHLADLASHAGWEVEEQIPLQTYHRYGYHMNNAVAAETLLLLRAS